MDFFRHQLTTFLKETIVIANTHTKYIRRNAINRKIMMQFCYIYDGSYYSLALSCTVVVLPQSNPLVLFSQLIRLPGGQDKHSYPPDYIWICQLHALSRTSWGRYDEYRHLM